METLSEIGGILWEFRHFNGFFKKNSVISKISKFPLFSGIPKRFLRIVDIPSRCRSRTYYPSCYELN